MWKSPNGTIRNITRLLAPFERTRPPESHAAAIAASGARRQHRPRVGDTDLAGQQHRDQRRLFGRQRVDVQLHRIGHRERADPGPEPRVDFRSEEHTSELQSLMRISYAVFCLKTTQTTI